MPLWVLSSIGLVANPLLLSSKFPKKPEFVFKGSATSKFNLILIKVSLGCWIRDPEPHEWIESWIYIETHLNCPISPLGGVYFQEEAKSKTSPKEVGILIHIESHLVGFSCQLLRRVMFPLFHNRFICHVNTNLANIPLKDREDLWLIHVVFDNMITRIGNFSC